MSYSDGQGNPGSSSDQTSAARGSSSAGSGPTTCPNCGREFEGVYCPSCGQEADPSVTVTGVAGDFFREFADLEGGFWATLVGLTLRPAAVLRRYLRGARAGLVSPGRYLLAALVISYGTLWVLVWAGFLQTPGSYLDSAALSEADQQAVRVFAEAIPRVYQSQWFHIGITLVTAGLFALILRRLFDEELRSGAEALASSAFLVGHATMLGTGVLLVSVPPLSLALGRPVAITTQSGIALLVAVLYVGTAVYGFRPGWKDATKAVFGVIGVQIETIGAAGLVAAGYALWSTTSSGTLSPDGAVFLGVVSTLYALPLLLHACVEAYYRLR